MCMGKDHSRQDLVLNEIIGSLFLTTGPSSNDAVSISKTLVIE